MAAKAAAAANPRSRSTKPVAKKASAKSAASAKKSAGKVARGSTGKRTPAKRTSAAKKPATARTVDGNVVTPVVWGPAQRTDELAQVLGGVTALAKALGVSPSQPSRWRSGKESPGPEAARKLVDLDHVVARAQLVWHPSLVPMWLSSANPHLGGQTPLGVLMTRGPNEVLDALAATEGGAFA